MSKWDKENFIEDMRANCGREVAKVGIRIIEFSEKEADELSWGRGKEHGTLTFKCQADVGLITLFHMSSDGTINLMLNYLRNKDLPKQVLRDLILKLEANFLREYDPEMYPVDTFEKMNEMFHTSNQIEKFIGAIEGACYRLRQ
ncbi:MAG: hypothetical protein ABIA75_12520 [Candidatus Neomarinimicrobiota bacterium]